MYREMEERLVEKENKISEYLDGSVYFLKETDSTNIYAKQIINENDGLIADPVVVLALKQTKGRGRLERKFESDEGGIYLSYCIRLKKDVKSITSYPIISALAVLKTVNEILKTYESNRCVKIKWPNDILTDGKKVCGILTEMVSVSDSYWIIFGVGLNVNNRLSEQLPCADSLSSIAGETIDIDLVIKQLILNLKSLFAEMPDNAEQLISDVQNNCLTIGKTIKSEGSGICGTATGIGLDGSLEVLKNDGTVAQIIYGDVTIVGNV